MQSRYGLRPDTQAKAVAAREVLATLLGSPSTTVASADMKLASLFTNTGDTAQARRFAQSAYDGFVQTYGPKSLNALAAGLNLSVLDLFAGRFAQALDVLQALRPDAVGFGGADSPMVQNIDFYRAVALTDLGRARQALPLLDHVDAGALERSSPASDWQPRLQAEHGRALLSAGDRAEGLKRLKEGVVQMEALGSSKTYLQPLQRALAAVVAR